MPNHIKYNTEPESHALNKGNFWIATGDIDKGPTSSTGFYNGITPPSGGYTVYVHKSSGGPSIQVASNDSELISITNSIAGTSYTTVNECFDYFNGQNDKLIWGEEVTPIITDGITSYIDFTSTACFPRTGNKFYNLANNGVGYLQSTTFSTNDGGKVITDGANNGSRNYVGSRININTTTNNVDRFSQNDNWTIAFWVKYTGTGSRIFSTGSAGSGTTDSCIWQFWLDTSTFYWWNSSGGSANNITSGISGGIPSNVWTYVTITYSYNESGNNVIRVYKNNILAGTGNKSTSTHSGRDRSTVTNLQYTLGGGYYSSCYTRNSSGEFGLFQVYNRTLSASEVEKNYNLSKGKFGL